MTISTDRDRVRLLVGDTSDDAPLLYDDEITHFVTSRTVLDSTGGTVSVNLEAAAADAAGAIAAKYARDFDFAEDGQRFDRAQRHGHYLALERTLRSRAGGYTVAVTST